MNTFAVRPRLPHKNEEHEIRLIVGAAEDRYEGWLATDKTTLNLVRQSDWASLLKPNSVHAILAEHVWEHLNSRDAIRAARNCFKYLAPGGYIRVAVPDGLHPDPAYIRHVEPGGSGAGAEDHRVLYTYRTLMTVFASVGFDITLLEYFSENGVFHYHEWNPDDGMITRSKRFDWRNATRELTYTSIILDARKPISSTNATSRVRTRGPVPPRPLILPAVAVSLAALALCFLRSDLWRLWDRIQKPPTVRVRVGGVVRSYFGPKVKEATPKVGVTPSHLNALPLHRMHELQVLRRSAQLCYFGRGLAKSSRGVECIATS